MFLQSLGCQFRGEIEIGGLFGCCHGDRWTVGPGGDVFICQWGAAVSETSLRNELVLIKWVINVF